MLGKWLLMSLGILAMVVGLIGVVVPLLPTTPFLLLAAACFVRSSDTLYDRLTSNRLLGGFIRDYREQRGVSARAKITALVVLWGVIGYTALMVVDLIWVRVLLAVIAVARHHPPAAHEDPAEELQDNWTAGLRRRLRPRMNQPTSTR